MQLSNIQENLSKTELMQRLQQIMQDAARAAQAAHTPAGDERSRTVQEQVAETQQSEQDPIRDEVKAKRERPGHKRRQRRDDRGTDVPGSEGLPTDMAGRLIDFTV